MFRGEADTPLLRALAHAGMTARDLAAHLGLSERTVGRYLAEEIQPSKLVRDQIKALLGENAC